MSYKQIKVYQDAKKLAVDIHRMTLNELPRFEMYEQGQQIRRSAKSVAANIVEGYGRRGYLTEISLFYIPSCYRFP